MTKLGRISFAEPYVLSLWMKLTAWGHGDSPFRAAYASLGDIWSFVGRGTPMMDMTATATAGMMSQIEKSMGMFNPAYVVESPNRLTIYFGVCYVHEASAKAFSWPIDELKANKDECEKVSIFYRCIDDCAMSYQSFAVALGADAQW